MEEAAAAMAKIHSQPHLSLHSCSDSEDGDNNGGSSSSGELPRGGGTASSGGRSSSSLRRRSCGDVVRAAAGSGGGGAHSSKTPPRSSNRRGIALTDEHAAKAYSHVSAEPGYVSFEDVIGAAALYRDGSGRPLAAAIGDPVTRMASRLHDRDEGKTHRGRQQSPGPLGTRRGSTMHGIVKKYVHPLQGFLAGIFCCIMPS